MWKPACNKPGGSKRFWAIGLGRVRQVWQSLRLCQSGNCPNHHDNQGVGQIPAPPLMDFRSRCGLRALRSSHLRPHLWETIADEVSEQRSNRHCTPCEWGIQQAHDYKNFAKWPLLRLFHTNGNHVQPCGRGMGSAKSRSGLSVKKRRGESATLGPLRHNRPPPSAPSLEG